MAGLPVYPLIALGAAACVLLAFTVWAIRRWRLRYSLRSLMIFVALACSCEGLYIFRGPWKFERTLAGHERIVWCAAFSPDGRRIVTASHDGTARVWDSSIGGELAVLKGHRGSVYSASFSPDGKTIVTASEDATARVWDSADGRELAALKAHTGLLNCASFSPDGKQIVTASYDGTVRIWRHTRPEWWWGIFCMLEFWFSAGFAAALVWSLLADRRAFARMDAEAAGAKSRRPA